MTGQPDLAVFVDGDDPVLVSTEVSRVVDELVGSGDRAFAVEDFAGDDIDLAAVADACATPPFLSDRRVVVVRDAGRFSTEEARPLLDYLEHPLPSTTLVLAAGSGSLAPKLAAAVKAQGRVIGTKVSGREAGAWIHDRIRQSGLQLDPGAQQALAGHLGEDLSRLDAILEVLSAAYGERARLSLDEIEPYLGEAGSVAPWDFTDAIDAGDADLALRLLHRLLGAGERHPLVVLAIVHRHVQSLLRVDSPEIRTEAQAAAAMGIAPGRSTYPAKKALAAARHWGSSGIAEAIGLVADAEVALKGAVAWPEEAVLEVLVARLCRLARSSGRPSRPPVGSR